MNNNLKNIKSKAAILAASCLLLLMQSCYKEFPYIPDIEESESLLFIDHQQVIVDIENQTALVPVKSFGSFNAVVSFSSQNSVKFNSSKVKSGELYKFENINAGSIVQVEITRADSSKISYGLEFTTLPLIHIEHKYGSIPEDEDMITKLTIVSPGEHKTFTEFCVLSTRGLTSLIKPKKSFNLQFVHYNHSNIKKNVELLGMNNDDDWILDAAYTDISMMRNRVSFDVWGDIQTDGINQGLSLLYAAPEGVFTEVFINNSYVGVYCLNERLDPKNIGFNKLPSTFMPCLYKSENWSPATTYSGLPDTTRMFKNWAGWEQKLPDPDQHSFWKPLYDFVAFVYQAPENDFADSIASYLNIDQAIDFYLFINLIQGYDNAGKNLFLAKRDKGQPFYLIPWDMDATWGRDWEGEALVGNEITFNLYKRIMAADPDNFNQKMAVRWFQLRKSVLQTSVFMQHFRNYSEHLIVSGAENRERERWPESVIELSLEIEYINSWAEKRLQQLDEYFVQFDN
jgi:hypothetical protein